MKGSPKRHRNTAAQTAALYCPCLRHGKSRCHGSGRLLFFWLSHRKRLVFSPDGGFRFVLGTHAFNPAVHKASEKPSVCVGSQVHGVQTQVCEAGFPFHGVRERPFQPPCRIPFQGTARVIFHSPANANPLLIQAVRYLFL